MLTLPDAILPVLHPFATLFRSPTWLKAQILLVGAILAPGQRTVAAALRVMGLSDDRSYARYHQVLNRAVWSPRQAAGILLVLLLQHLDQGDGPLIFGIDETLERRRGPKIKSLGIYRDAVRSSRSQVVKATDSFRDLDVVLVLPQRCRIHVDPSVRHRRHRAARARFVNVGTDEFRFGSAKHLGKDAAGEWTLRITDHYSEDTGNPEVVEADRLFHCPTQNRIYGKSRLPCTTGL